ncbi:MAG: hypothetical protein U0798_16535 [Gemmataceae bacterium]
MPKDKPNPTRKSWLAWRKVIKSGGTEVEPSEFTDKGAITIKMDTAATSS